MVNLAIFYLKCLSSGHFLPKIATTKLRKEEEYYMRRKQEMAMTIGKKLNLSTLLFTLVALVPLGVLAIMAISTARNSFIQERFSQLQSVRDIKRSQIQKFFEDREADMGVLVGDREHIQK